MNTFSFDPKRIGNGGVLLLGIRYNRPASPDETRGMTSPRVFTYAMLKAGGLWYVTGSGQVPTAAGWGAVERWLAKDNRVVEWLKMASDWKDLYPVPGRIPYEEQAQRGHR